jgi:hypothetical protein
MLPTTMTVQAMEPMTSAPAATPALAYATPTPARGARVGAGFALVLGGLGLVVLGGCFLIGVLIINQAHQISGNALQFSDVVLECILYVSAVASFGGAGWILTLATRGLLAVLRM